MIRGAPRAIPLNARRHPQVGKRRRCAPIDRTRRAAPRDSPCRRRPARPSAAFDVLLRCTAARSVLVAPRGGRPRSKATNLEWAELHPQAVFHKISRESLTGSSHRSLSLLRVRRPVPRPPWNQGANASHRSRWAGRPNQRPKEGETRRPEDSPGGSKPMSPRSTINRRSQGDRRLQMGRSCPRREGGVRSSLRGSAVQHLQPILLAKMRSTPHGAVEALGLPSSARCE